MSQSVSTLIETSQAASEHAPLPDGWRWLRLGDIATVGPDNGIFKKRHEFGKGVPIVNVLDLFRDIKVDLSKVERVEATKAEQARYGIANGDLFFCRSSLKREGVGWCCYVADVSEPSVFECHVMRVRPNPEIAFSEYIAYYWRYPVVREEVISKAKTATMTTMNQQDLASVQIPLPPLYEQKRIIEILNEQMATVGRARAAAEAQLKAAKDLPAAYLREAFDSPTANRWERKPLRDYVLSYRNGFGRRPKELEEGAIVLRLADVSSGVVDISNPRRGAMSPKEFSTYQLLPSDVLFVRVNGSSHLIGRCIPVNLNRNDLAYNDHLIRVRLRDELDSNYLKAICDLPEVRTEIIEKASTSAGQLTINQDVIASIKVPTAPISEQQRLVSTLKEKAQTVSRAIAAMQDQLDSINNLPTALLRQAFTGKL